jgi:hypothetical protein
MADATSIIGVDNTAAIGGKDKTSMLTIEGKSPFGKDGDIAGGIVNAFKRVLPKKMSGDGIIASTYKGLTEQHNTSFIGATTNIVENADNSAKKMTVIGR